MAAPRVPLIVTLADLGMLAGAALTVLGAHRLWGASGALFVGGIVLFIVCHLGRR